MSLYCSSSRLGLLGARSWNARFLSTSLSFRIMYQFVFYWLVCIENFELLNIVCMVFVGVKNYLYFNQLIASLNLKEFKLHSHWNVRKSSQQIKVHDAELVPKFIWANELETKKSSPVSEVNNCSVIARLHKNQTSVKINSNFKTVLKEQRRQNYLIDLPTTWESCIHVQIAVVVLIEFVQPLVLCSPGRTPANSGNTATYI